MIIALVLLAATVLIAVGVLIMRSTLSKAPVGYEDQQGFHADAERAEMPAAGALENPS